MRRTTLLAGLVGGLLIASSLAAAPPEAESALSPAESAAPQRTLFDPQTAAQVQQDREWLVAYLLTQEGYRWRDLEMIDARLDQMTPVQLREITEIYRQRQQQRREQGNLERRVREHKVAQIEEQTQRYQSGYRGMSKYDAAAAVAQQTRANQGTLEAYRANVGQTYSEYRYRPPYLPYYAPTYPYYGYNYRRYW